MPLLPAPLVEPSFFLDHPAMLQQVRFLDCRAGPGAAEAFRAQHLPGAVHASLDQDLAGDASSPATGGRHPLPDLGTWARTLGLWGLTPESLVVVYDDRAGALAAARAWWMLTASGHAEVAVLHGGLRAALDAGLPMQRGDVTLHPRAPYPVEAWTLPTVTADEVASAAADPTRRVIDVREAQRYRGEHEPIDPVAGHIPGAVNVPYTEHLTQDGHLLPHGALAHHLRAALGGLPAHRVFVHCGSGVTACHTLLAMEAAGLSGASLYVGSWSEWCRSGRPQATSGG
jgi:thiosulfate/3-mercaptopyruvate sulfurtransferase